MRTVGWLGVCFVVACAGKAPPNQQTPDAAGPDIDAPPLVTGQVVSGKTIDYFGNVNLQTSAIESDGLDPQVTTTSDANDATYMLQVPIGSKFFLIVGRPGYRLTRNPPLAAADMPVSADLYAMSGPDVKRQYTTLGKTPTAGTAFLAATMLMSNGTPVTAIPLANVTLLNAQNQPVPGVLGPYFFGSAGDIDPALTTATAYGTPLRSRVAFLDIPVGTYTLSVTYPGAAGNVQDNTTITAAADGAIIAQSGGAKIAGTNAADPHFAQDIYPRLQRAASGGLGCANCHTTGGPAAILRYDDPPDTVLANVRAATGVINATTPAQSFLVEHPLYKAPPATQDHPNATFLDVNDPDYKLFLLWITNGTKP
jgi:hypothetical protein